MNEIVVECNELTKSYKHALAVDHLNLTIRQGEVFGLLGPNGAGKTTTILMMMGLTEPTSGQVRVFGYDSTKEPIKVKQKVGYLQDNVGFYNYMTARENLEFIAELNQIPLESIDIDHILKRVGLYEHRSKKVGSFSRGMKQRLGVADLLVKQSEIIILDEPTLGLDPDGIEDMLKLIFGLTSNDNKTVIISSHLLNQVQKICTRIGMFNHGRLISSGTIRELSDQYLGEDAEPNLEDIYRKCFGQKEVAIDATA